MEFGLACASEISLGFCDDWRYNSCEDSNYFLQIEKNWERVFFLQDDLGPEREMNSSRTLKQKMNGCANWS